MSMKIIKVEGCSNCPHGALWDIETRKYICAKKKKVNDNTPPYPPEWCPLEDAIQFVKELVNQHARTTGDKSKPQADITLSVCEPSPKKCQECSEPNKFICKRVTA